MDFFRPRTPLPRDWQYDVPEGKLATPAQSAEYRRRRRRVGLYQGLVLLSLPVFVWGVLAFLRNPVLAFVSFIVYTMGLGFLLTWIGRSFCCPLCGMWFDRLAPRWPSRASQRRWDEMGKGTPWCESCGTRFVLYPKSNHLRNDKPDDDGGFGIL